MIGEISFRDDRVVGMGIAGEITPNDVDKFWAIIEERLTRNERLRIYVEYRSCDGIALRAMFKKIPQKLKHFKAFEREAIVSEKSWLGSLARVGDKLFPSIEVKHFPTTEKRQARLWITEP